MITQINLDSIQDTRFRAGLMSSTLLKKSEQRADIIRTIVDSPIAQHLKRIIGSTDNLLKYKLEQLNQKST